MVSTTRPDLAEIVESDVLNTGISDEDRRSLARALAFAADLYGEKLLGTGEPAYEHAVGTARKAAELRLDAHARAAALLFAVPAYLPAAEEKLTESFGAAVASLVAGISRLNELRVVVKTAALGKDSGPQAEVLRKMLLAMVKDVRVVLLRLASRTQTLRWLARAPEAERAQLARETLDIYAPSPIASACGSSSGSWKTWRSATSSPSSTSASPACSMIAAASASASSSRQSALSPTSSPAPESAQRSPAGRSTSTASTARCARS